MENIEDIKKIKIEDEKMPSVSREDTLFYLLNKVKENISFEERERITPLLIEKMNPENIGKSIIEMLGYAIPSKDKEMLRFVLEDLQRRIHEGNSTNLDGMPISDEDIKKLIETGIIRIEIGSGTRGHRIFIKDGRIFMSYDERVDQRHAENFRKIFDLDDDTKELTIEIK